MSSRFNPVIVVVAYNRPESLQRLLNSLKAADYPAQQVTLIISIDKSDTDSCVLVAEEFDWEFGIKEIKIHQTQLGLKKHILSCGDYTHFFGSVILLEDDLFVSPQFYNYSLSALEFYDDDPRIAGVSLYAYRYNESAACSFEPIVDEYDNYFIQFPSSWGQAWTRNQWNKFRLFLEKGEDKNDILFPPRIESWPTETSWKKAFVAYLIVSNSFFVYPRISLTTNYGDVGKHYDVQTDGLQVPLILSRKEYSFSLLDQSFCCYNVFFELHINSLAFFQLQNITFDLNASIPSNEINTEFVITARNSKNPIKKFQTNLFPYELNILLNRETKHNQSFFVLSRTSDLMKELVFDRSSNDTKRFFFSEERFRELQAEVIKKSIEYKLGAFIIRKLPFFVKLLKR